MPEYLDETFEERENREKFEYFYGQYTSDVRKKLLSKNIVKPENIYDVLYTKVRAEQLNKNSVPFTTSVDKIAEGVRDTLIAKTVAQQINLEDSGEAARRTQIGKNKLLESSIDLNSVSESVRAGMLSKNTEVDSNLDKASERYRQQNLNSNSPKEKDLDASADLARSTQTTKNDEKIIDLDNYAQSARNSQLRTNDENNINIDKTADQARLNHLSRNGSNNIDLDSKAEEAKKTQESKNSYKEVNLDNIADAFRSNNTSKNDAKDIDIDAIADNARSTNESANNIKAIDLDKTADSVRDKQLSTNDDSSINLDKTADSARKNQIAQTKSNEVNLDKQGDAIRNNQLSFNKESENTIDKTAESSRGLQISANKLDETNLDASAEKVRDKLLSANDGKEVDLDKSAEQSRENLLASNVPKVTDLDASADASRNNLLGSNVAKNIDLDKDSQAPRNGLLASNVAKNIDLDKDAAASRNPLLAGNVPSNIDLDKEAKTSRNNLLASNVPNNIDLDANAAQTRGSLLASNVPSPSDLDALSEEARQALLNSNQSNPVDLDNAASVARNTLLASNTPSDASIDRHANAIRNTLLAANNATESQMENIADIFRHDLLSKNAKIGGLGTNVYFGGTSTFIGVSNLEIISAPIRELTKLKNKIFDKKANVQSVYGVATDANGLPTAKITNAIQLYNIQKNTFASVRYGERTAAYSILLNHNADGFQQLLSYGANINAEVYPQTNTTPFEVVDANQGAYIGLPTREDGTSPATILLKKEGNRTVIGTAESMMSVTSPTDAIAANFNLKQRGVSHIINTIKRAGSRIPLANNFNVQTNNKFLIGDNKYAYSRYTIANPYQPNKDAGVLELRIKNYAIANGNKRLVNTMSFPPYVKSFANSDSANWNKIDFLGRPEPIYTYSNSSREGSLSFYVLTDYAQVVDMGYDYINNKPIQDTFDKHFTDSSDKKEITTDLEVEIANRNEKIAALNTQLTNIEEDDVANIATLRLQITEEQIQVNSLQNKLKNLQSGSDLGPNRKYKEHDALNGNVYKSLIMNSAERDTSGNINLTTEGTVDRLKRMKKDMLFQPAYFSGDKVDFVTRMEFLSKLTRPSRNTSGKGFAFTYPPVAHLQLGDWFDHDVIINNVSYDYSEAPWTIDGLGGRTQPMWALVTLSFNIVGTYKGTSADNVPLATDTGGFFQKRVK